MITSTLEVCHCVKSVQIRSYFWSVFFCIQSEYRKIRTRNNSVFGHFSRSAIPLRLSGHNCQKNAYWRRFLKFIGKVKNQQNINHLKCILGFNKHNFDLSRFNSLSQLKLTLQIQAKVDNLCIYWRTLPSQHYHNALPQIFLC